jgi:4'-phosphopantetheinyl transferase
VGFVLHKIKFLGFWCIFMVKTYLLELSSISGRRDKLISLISNERRARVLRLSDSDEALRSLGAGLLLRYALERAGIPASEQQFSKNAFGKPELLSGSPQFSLSHSGNIAVCSIGDFPLGVDTDTARCTERIAKRYFHPDETSYILSLDETSKSDALGRIWVAKEAFTKAIGKGLTFPLNGFKVELTPYPALLFQDVSELPYKLFEYRFGEYFICLCAAEDAAEPEVVTI